MVRGDYYSLLGVSRYASREAIKRAFRTRLLATHPDRNPEDCFADERTRLIVEAYTTLNNPLSRRQYDQSISTSIPAKAIGLHYRKIEYSPVILQVVSILCMVALTLLISSLIIYILDNRTPAFRPDTRGLQKTLPQNRSTLIMKLDISTNLEWKPPDVSGFRLCKILSLLLRINIYIETIKMQERNPETSEPSCNL